MSDDSQGRSRLGAFPGDYDGFVSRDPDEQHPNKQWNRVTYSCAFCRVSFLSRAMMRRHLRSHVIEGGRMAEEQTAQKGATEQRPPEEQQAQEAA